MSVQQLACVLDVDKLLSADDALQGKGVQGRRQQVMGWGNVYVTCVIVLMLTNSS